ncbi:MAG: molecular chaperone TorD family protein [Eggerthellaceae bacterium]|jgi:TorA maturation chaperone TorD|nr:molecular chaperone TorD family protein [Eggerthellaceae bacterium]
MTALCEVDERTADERVARAELFELLAHSFAYPDEELAQALSDGSYAQAARQVCAETDAAGACAGDIDRIDQAYRGVDAQHLLHALRAEYTRIYIGTTSAAVSPYGSWWKAVQAGKEPVLFLSKETRAVEKAMHDAGVGNRPGNKEPLDHIACELDFARYLSFVLAGAAPARADVAIDERTLESFLDEHLRPWAPDFARKTAETTTSPLYRFVASLLETL